MPLACITDCPLFQLIFLAAKEQEVLGGSCFYNIDNFKSSLHQALYLASCQDVSSSDDTESLSKQSWGHLQCLSLHIATVRLLPGFEVPFTASMKGFTPLPPNTLRSSHTCIILTIELCICKQSESCHMVHGVISLVVMVHRTRSLLMRLSKSSRSLQSRSLVLS